MLTEIAYPRVTVDRDRADRVCAATSRFPRLDKVNEDLVQCRILCLIHVTSPQVVTYDCAFDIVDVYEDGLVRFLYEIDDRRLLRFSQEHMRQMHPDKPEFSYGLDMMRNFTFMFTG